MIGANPTADFAADRGPAADVRIFVRSFALRSSVLCGCAQLAAAPWGRRERSHVCVDFRIFGPNLIHSTAGVLHPSFITMGIRAGASGVLVFVFPLFLFVPLDFFGGSVWMAGPMSNGGGSLVP